MFDPGPVSVRFVLEKVALEQAFRAGTSVVPSSIIAAVLCIRLNLNIPLSQNKKRANPGNLKNSVLFWSFGMKSTFILSLFQGVNN
jgi:hypothetical protein